ncbi:hypothetical protein [Microbacterium candidum]|uniref:Nucleotidyltransferase n=1 Tax=Microbacterium candidum TaxID=3041922 RepID=A0ABT7N245_9MICO|nr:hypothetical protein [Microbacterium sp. ASV49]MDL9980741.1 hypothetical protein [Microbacterium sp. ASV49]
MVDDLPTRMVYAGHRWRITDTPTRMRESVWAAPREHQHGLYGWRFQATDEEGHAVVFDVCEADDGWHVHHMWD